MRTTIDIDDDLLREIKKSAIKQEVSVKSLLNRALRAGLQSLNAPPNVTSYRCPTFSMGAPHGDIDLDKARSIVAALEDDEIVRKLSLRK